MIVTCQQEEKVQAYQEYMDQWKHEYIREFELEESLNLLLGWNDIDEVEFINWVREQEVDQMYDFEDWFTEKCSKHC